MARCNRGKLGKKDVPVEGKEPGWAEYDTVYLGFPIWYYAAPNVIQTFCKDHGANNIRLSTKETNTYALSMYRKAGFHDTGEMNDVEIVLQIDL